jgi:iron complex outermembrane receptor protein
MSAALVAAAPDPVFAQRAAEQLPPLIVDGEAASDSAKGYVARRTDTATKSDVPVLALPRSVSTVTKQEIEDRSAQTVQEALNYTAGVNTYFRQGNLSREYNRVRGFEAFQFLDGLKLHDSSWGYEVYGLERIDVLKGPASTLYGQGSPGGLINLTSKRPKDTPFREFMLRTGSYGRLEGGFDIGGPANADKSVLYRVVGLGRMGDGEIDFTRNERIYFAPSVTLRNDQTSLTVLAHYQYDPNLTALQPLPRVGTILPGANGQYISRKLFLGEPNYHDTSKKTFRIGYEFNHRFNDVFSFQQNLAYQNIDVQLNEVQSRGTLVGNSVVRQMAYQPYKIDLFQVDNRFKADFATGPFRHHVMFGLDYSMAPNSQGTAVNRASQYLLNLYAPVYGQPLGANPLTQMRYQAQRQTGIYAQDRIEIGGFSVIGGVRGDWASLDQKTKVLNTTTGLFSEPDWSPKRDRATTVHSGLIYAFESGVAPYVNYSESFAPISGADVAGKPFDPTTGEQFEAGIKYLPSHLNLLITGAVFEITQRNMLTNDLKNPGFAVQTQEIRAKGAEIEFKTTNLHGFNVVAGYTYLDPTVTKTNTAGGVGKAPTGMAQHQASLWGTYTFDDGTVLKGLTVGGGIRHVGASFGDALNTFEVPAFTLFDMTLRYQLGAISAALTGWDVAINAKNLADKRYVGVCEDALNCYYGAGRTIDATMRVRF